jgi:DNA-binding transcriptional ArsR family regulator
MLRRGPNRRRRTVAGMTGDADLTVPAGLIADRSRAAMLDALLSGQALAAGELAQLAGIGRPAASEHLQRLLAGGLVEVVVQGRHRYYRLANPTVAEALEALAHLAPPRPVRTLRQSNTARSLAYARTCYDHLAGTVGVALLDLQLAQGWLCDRDGGYDVTDTGVRRLDALGVDPDEARRARRIFARPCLDWTERRPHLAGSLAAAITGRLIDLGWLVRRNAAGRALRLTPAGRTALNDLGCTL